MTIVRKNISGLSFLQENIKISVIERRHKAVEMIDPTPFYILIAIYNPKVFAISPQIKRI